MPTKVVRSAMKTTLGPRGKTLRTEMDWAYYRSIQGNAGPYRKEGLMMTGAVTPSSESTTDAACYSSTYVPPG